MATRRDELLQAMRLVYGAYVRLGLIPKNRFGLHVTPYHTLRDTEVLLAESADQIVATLTLILDSPFGLPLESIYANEVGRFRRAGYRLAEVGCLADLHEVDDQVVSKLFRLMSFTAQRACHHLIDRLLIAVHPHHVKFYERFLGFEICGDTKAYAKVCGAPAVLLSLDLSQLANHHPRAYKRLFSDRFPAEVLERQVIPRPILAELEMIAAELHPEDALVPHVETAVA